MGKLHYKWVKPIIGGGENIFYGGEQKKLAMFLFYYVLFVDTSSNLRESILKGGEQYNDGDWIILKLF